MNKTYKTLMVVCSMAAIGAAAAFFFFKIPVRNVGFGLMILICPLSHLLMMKFMGHDHGKDPQHEGNPKDVINDSASQELTLEK